MIAAVLHVLGIAIAFLGGCVFGRAVAAGEKVTVALALGVVLIGVALAALSTFAGVS